MRFDAFCGETYQSYSTNVEGERCINLFPEFIESGHGKNQRFALYRSPGTLTHSDVEDGPSRPKGAITIPASSPSTDRVFEVSGSTLYEVFEDGSTIDRGDVGNDGFAAYMAYNGDQLAIASNLGLYIYHLDTNALDPPVAGVEAVSVVFLDQYFLANEPGTQNIRYSAVLDGTSWDPLDIFASETNPDRVLTLLTSFREVIAFGDSSVQAFASTGDPDNAFAPSPSSLMEQGCGAPASPAIFDNGFIWVGKDPSRGGPIVWLARGRSPERVSNHSVEQFFESYSTIADASSFVITMQGHEWYQLNFPTANKSWRYDAATKRWHEVSCFNAATGEYEAHHAINHTVAWGKHIVGDRGGECCTSLEDGGDGGGGEGESCIAAAVFPIEMVTTPLYWDDAAPSSYRSCQVHVDPANYSTILGATFIGRIDQISSTEPDYTFHLVDENNTIYKTITIETPASGSIENYEFVFPVEIDTENAHYYTVRIQHGETFTGALVVGKLYINATDLTDVAIQIPMLASNVISTGGGLGNETDNDRAAYAHTASFALTGTYGFGQGSSSGQGHAVFTKDEAAFDTITTWELRANAWTAGMIAGQYGRVALFNKTTNTMVAGSEIQFAFDEVNPETKTVLIPNDAANFTNGHDFEVRLLRSHGSTELQVGRADLWVYVHPVEKFRVYDRTLATPRVAADNSVFVQFMGDQDTPHQTVIAGDWGFDSSSDVQRVKLVQFASGAPEVANPSILQLDKFTTPSIGTPITSVKFYVSAEIQGSNPVIDCEGRIGMRARIGGVDEEEHMITQDPPTWFLSDDPGPPFALPLREFDLTADRAWTAADFADGTLKVRLKVEKVGTGVTNAFFDGTLVSYPCGFIVEWDDPVTPDAYSTIDYECVE